jgi:hypothetical protein
VGGVVDPFLQVKVRLLNWRILAYQGKLLRMLLSQPAVPDHRFHSHFGIGTNSVDIAPASDIGCRQCRCV